MNITDQGKYTCQASNEAGTSNIDLLLKVYVPPRIDTSNIVGSPLGIMGRKIYLECPILIGIPHPSVTWTKDGKPIDLSDSRLILAQVCFPFRCFLKFLLRTTRHSESKGSPLPTRLDTLVTRRTREAATSLTSSWRFSVCLSTSFPKYSFSSSFFGDSRDSRVHQTGG